MAQIMINVTGMVIIQIKFKYFKFLLIKNESKIIVKIINTNSHITLDISRDSLSPLIIVEEIIKKEINVNILINLLSFLKIK